MKRRLLLVGLTGNFGSGKSHVLNLFKDLGAITINSDEVVRELLKKEEIKKEIKDLLNCYLGHPCEDIIMPDGELNRKAIADIIFNDAYLRLKLEDIIHPEVFREIERRTAEINEENIVIVEVPVLFERGYQNRFDRIITVYSDEETALKRLTLKGLTREEIIKRWNSQFPYDKKIRASDFIIDNSEGKDLMSQIKSIYSQLERELRRSSERKS